MLSQTLSRFPARRMLGGGEVQKPAAASRLCGELEELKPWGVRIRRRPRASDAPEFWSAPLAEVGKEVLAAAAKCPHVCPARPGFRGGGSSCSGGGSKTKGARVVVGFEEIPGRCSSGDLRARFIGLWPEGEPERLDEPSDPPSLEPACVVSEPPQDPVASYLALVNLAGSLQKIARRDGFVLPPSSSTAPEEGSPRTEESPPVDVEHLEASLRKAVASKDAEALCDLLVTVAEQLSAAATAAARDEISLTEEAEDDGLRRLRNIAIACLLRLDLAYEGVTLRVLPALRRLQLLLARDGLDKKAGASWSRLQWQRISRLIGECLEKLPMQRYRRFGAWCHFPNCKAAAVCKATTADSFGPPGYRCADHKEEKIPNTEPGHTIQPWRRHVVSRCEVCGRWADRRVRHETPGGDFVQGLRCRLHFSTTRSVCTVANCHRRPKRRVTVADHWGPPGARCAVHGGQDCVVIGCIQMGWGKVSEKDSWGDVGLRCWLHGGHRCNIGDCRRQPNRIARVADEFGPPGHRCGVHSRPLGPKKEKATLPSFKIVTRHPRSDPLPRGRPTHRPRVREDRAPSPPKQKKRLRKIAR